MNPPNKYIQTVNNPLMRCVSTFDGSRTSAADYKLIPLTQGKYAIVDTEDFDELSKYTWFAKKHICLRNPEPYRENWYAFRIQIISKNKSSLNPNRKRISIRMQRQVMKLKKGDNRIIDHIYHNTLDYRKQNLRICTRQQNSFNRLKGENYTSIYKGVFWAKWAKRWRINIQKSGKIYRLGYSKNEIEAAKIYDAKALELFGEFAYTNF